MEIDENKFDKYLLDLMSEPLFGRPIAEKLLKRNSQLRKEILLMLAEAQQGRFTMEEIK